MLREGNHCLHFSLFQKGLRASESRLKERKGHFFKPQMLITQFGNIRRANE